MDINGTPKGPTNTRHTHRQIQGKNAMDRWEVQQTGADSGDAPDLGRGLRFRELLWAEGKGLS